MLAGDIKTGKFISVLSCSEGDEVGKWGSGERTQRRRKAPDEPTIEETLRPVPASLEEIENAPTAHSTASAIEWLADIETIRSRSSYQGVLSRRIKERVAALKRVLEVLAVRVEARGDLEYHKRRNQELQGQLLASQREMIRMDRRINELQRTIEELKGIIINDEGTRIMKEVKETDKETDRYETPGQERTIGAREKEMGRPKMESLPPVKRPPIQGVSSIIPERSRSRDIQEDANISRQIVDLVNKRKALRERMEIPPNQGAGESPRPGGRGPRVISNVQLIPPPPREGRQLVLEKEIEGRKDAPGINSGSEWVKVVRNKSKRKQIGKEQQESDQFKVKEKEGIKRKNEGDDNKKLGPQKTKPG